MSTNRARKGSFWHVSSDLPVYSLCISHSCPVGIGTQMPANLKPLQCQVRMTPVVIEEPG